ncbi:hypothetical protein [Treponema sp. SP13]|uniref:hypothetical protein n=1 Tax=Treponema sp. SP13 TaxID=2789742 RepID=UPI003D94564C
METKETCVPNRQVLVAGIRECETREEVENTFALFSVSDDKERYDVLVEAMYQPEMFFSTDNPAWKLRYELALELFLTKTWKVPPFYEQRGAV